jgi:hypothetical protein
MPVPPIPRPHVPVGILRRAFISSVNQQQGFITAEIDTSSTTLPNDTQKKRRVQIPFSFYSVEGLFLGGLPKVGTPIIIGQGEGTSWYFVSFNVSNISQLPVLNDGELLAQANSNTRLSLGADNTINLGSQSINLHLNTSTKKVNNKFQSTFSNKFSFSEAAREITGIIKRELKADNAVSSSLKLTSEDYDQNLTAISLDPTLTTVITTHDASKNPPFIEKREIVYEFAYSSGVSDDITESALYSQDQQQNIQDNTTFLLPNRRESKTDTLSLSLVAPNFLMESVRGTVVDIFGNILDINRSPILGFNINNPDLSLTSKSVKDNVFLDIKAAERKSVAYHFELNARKDLSAGNGKFQLPDINSTSDYARSRSRFFFDIDKEGQFKLNIPASSETGNIPLRVRYENYSTFGTEDNSNPNKLIFRDDYLDIFLDSFANNEINITDGNKVLTPIDRISGSHIKHGMPYHSLLNSGVAFQDTAFLGYQLIDQTVDITKIPTLNKIVSDTIVVGGNNPNGGGRSGSINLDGFLEVSIGANTVDRQSLWLDTAGGIIANIGRDKNFVSSLISLDGDLFVQVGGLGVAGDSRFSTLNNAYRGGTLDIRVMHDGFTTSMVRIDKNGITIMTPSNLTMHARNMNIQADGQLNISADRLYLQDREVNKFPIVSI